MSHSIKVEFDVAATMRDGTLLRANVFRPFDHGDFPVALNRTPYGKDFATSNIVLDAVRLAREGYIVVIQDVRGRFNSGGEWYPLRHEASDGFDTVEWAARLSGSNGSVGMFGASYTGFTQWAAATQAPPHLKALVPVMTWADMLDGASWRGGALELGTVAEWLLEGLAFDVIVRRYRERPALQRAAAIGSLVREINNLRTEGYRFLPLSDFQPLRKLEAGGHFFELIAQPNSPEACAPYSAASSYDRVRVPAFNIGGWYDIFAQGTIQNFASLRTGGVTPESRMSRLLIGPWSHSKQHHVVGQMDFGFGSMMEFINLEGDLTAMTQRWFDFWLKGRDNGVDREPPVKLFIMGENVWRNESEFPLTRTKYTSYYLRGYSRLSREMPADEPADHYLYDPDEPTPTSGGAILMNDLFNPGVQDQRHVEARPDVLIYDSEPLENDTEVTGPVKVILWASSDASDTDFVARLVDVHPDGFARNLTDGIIRARYRNGAVAELLEPGRAYEFSIDLWSTASLFKAGHRIRIDIASSSFPRWDRNPNTGARFGTDTALLPARQTIMHDAAHPSRIILPIIPR